LPKTLEQAVGQLQRSAILRKAMGEVLFEAFLATRRGEIRAFSGMDDVEVIRAHRWRY
jgi:glutamine synthetase